MTQVKFPTSDLCKGQRAHSEAISSYAEFLPITFDYKKIQTCGWSHCVSLVDTRRMTCNMTYFGAPVILTWVRSRSRGHPNRSCCVWSDASRREKRNETNRTSESLFTQELLAKQNSAYFEIASKWARWPLQRSLVGTFTWVINHSAKT